MGVRFARTVVVHALAVADDQPALAADARTLVVHGHPLLLVAYVQVLGWKKNKNEHIMPLVHTETETYSAGSNCAYAAGSKAAKALWAVCPAKSPPAGLDFLKSASTKVVPLPSTSSSRSQITDGSL